MASLDEIRKRFGKTSLNAMDENNGSGSAAHGAGGIGGAFGLTGATLKIFDPLKRFEVQVSEITKIAEPLEKVLNQTARALDEIKVFYAEMERLSLAYEGIRTFQAALSADGARELREQFDAIAKIFYENLSTTAALLDPAREFQARISELARVFDGLKPLQDQFTELAKKFKTEKPANPNTIVLDQAAVKLSPAVNIVR